MRRRPPNRAAEDVCLVMSSAASLLRVRVGQWERAALTADLPFSTVGAKRARIRVRPGQSPHSLVPVALLERGAAAARLTSPIFPPAIPSTPRLPDHRSLAGPVQTTMSCSCRMAPLRTFISGLAQVHRLEASSPSLWLAAPRHTAPTQRLIVTRQARPFHRSKQLNQQDSVAPAATPRDETPGESFGSTNTSHDATASPSEGDWTPPARRPKKSRVSADKTGTSPDKGNRKFNFRGKPKTLSLTPSRDQADPRYEKGKRQDGRPARDQTHEDSDSKEPPKETEQWRIQKEAIKNKFPGPWRPSRRLSPDALAGIRALNAQFPDVYNSATLSKKFDMSPEHIRRILKNRWQPTPEEEEERQERWHRRGVQVWERKAALGIKPPKKWRQEGVNRDPEYLARRKHAIQMWREWEEGEREKYRAQLALRRNTGRVL